MSAADVALSPVFKNSGRVCRRSESIDIYLIVGGSVIPMRILESDSIASVKLRIQRCKGFVVKKQKLVFGGRELSRNDSLVKDYGVSSGDVLHLILKFSDHLVITVETAFGRHFEFEVARFPHVGYLKRKIVEQARSFCGFVNVEEQEILCKNEKLDAALHLFVKKPAHVRSKPVERDLEISIESNVGDETDENRKKPPDIEPVFVNPKLRLPPVMNNMIECVSDGLAKGKPPVQSSEGTGGTYFMLHPSGNRYVAVFKPVDEEPMAVNNPQGLPPAVNGEGLKRGTKVGEGALREVAAYILDHPRCGRRPDGGGEVGFAGVPPTVMVRCLNRGFNHPRSYVGGPKDVKVGSLQMFVKNCGSCEDMGPRDFPVEEVHKITVLDIRTANADRHSGNILMSREGGRIVLTPIDHGYCLPENFEDCTFDWLYWPQAREPYSPQTLAYIASLDAEADLTLLRRHGWSVSRECARTLCVATMLLKKGAARGMSPFAIGRVMCRETLNRESAIERIVGKACDAVLPGTSEAAFLEAVSDVMDSELDEIVE